MRRILQLLNPSQVESASVPAAGADRGKAAVERPVYMDNLATTRVDPAVLAAMIPWFTDDYGNAASRTHAFGWRAAEAVEVARAQVAALIGAERSREVIFTSGATESNNLALIGVATALGRPGDQVVVSAVEHRSVLDPAAVLGRRGFLVTVLPVDRAGRADLDSLRRALARPTVLVSVMAANNEVGTLQPWVEAATMTRAAGALFHCDAVQAAGKVPLRLATADADLVSLSAHKLHGPKGVGALYVRTRRPRVRLQPLLHGGGQERGTRPGTLNVPGIVGFGQACALATDSLDAEAARLQRLRDRLHQALERELGPLPLNGHPVERLPGCLNLGFPGLDGSRLLPACRGVALSAGSACTSGDSGPSHVLRAMGVDAALALASLRFGLSRFTTIEEVDYAAGRVTEAVRWLRGLG